MLLVSKTSHYSSLINVFMRFAMSITLIDKTTTAASVSTGAHPSDANAKCRKFPFLSPRIQAFTLLLKIANTKPHVCPALKLLHFVLRSLDGRTRTLYCSIAKNEVVFHSVYKSL